MHAAARHFKIIILRNAAFYACALCARYVTRSRVLRNGIVAAGMKRMTANDSLYCKKKPFARPVFFNRFDRILRTRRRVPAARRKQRRNTDLIGADAKTEKFRKELFHSVINPAFLHNNRNCAHRASNESRPGYNKKSISYPTFNCAFNKR